MGLRVKELLKEKGITTYQLAEHLGVTQPTVSMAMNGNPNTKWLEKVAAFLGVSVGDLFDARKEETKGRFIALIDHNGKLFRFDNLEALKEFIAELNAEATVSKMEITDATVEK